MTDISRLESDLKEEFEMFSIEISRLEVMDKRKKALWVWCTSARTLVHKIANEVLLRARVRLRLTLILNLNPKPAMEQCTCTSTPNPAFFAVWNTEKQSKAAEMA